MKLNTDWPLRTKTPARDCKGVESGGTAHRVRFVVVTRNKDVNCRKHRNVLFMVEMCLFKEKVWDKGC